MVRRVRGGVIRLLKQGAKVADKPFFDIDLKVLGKIQKTTNEEAS